MLVGKSLPEYLCIRLAITALRLITPLCISYLVYLLIEQPSQLLRPPPPSYRRWRRPLEIYMLAEVLFFFLCFLPLRHWLQRKASHPEPFNRADRQILFDRCMESTLDIDTFLCKWFLGASVEQIKRENVKEFFAWSLMNARYEDITAEEHAELDHYADGVESKLKRRLEPGRGSAQCLRVSMDEVGMQHRPLIWYMIIFLVDCISSGRLLFQGYQFHRLPLSKSLRVFPFRPLSVISRHKSPATHTTYWLRPHTSTTHLPMVMIQGIGVGLYAYVDFLIALAQEADIDATADGRSDDGGEMGIMVVEIMPISARICPGALSTAEMKEEIRMLLDAHGWDEVVLIGHSYGTAIAATILRDPALSKRVKAAMLMDPICFLLHLPDVAYNFTRRRPIHANEHMLHYFSSQDMMVSHTLARHFFWSEYILWREDLAELNLPLKVTLSGQDLIVPAAEVWRYLIIDEDDREANDAPATTTTQPYTGDMEYDGRLARVLWFNDFDHAGLLSSKGARRGMAQAAREYCLTASGND